LAVIIIGAEVAVTGFGPWPLRAAWSFRLLAGKIKMALETITISF